MDNFRDEKGRIIKGSKFPKEYKEKMSLACKKFGVGKWNKGSKRTKEFKKIRSELTKKQWKQGVRKKGWKVDKEITKNWGRVGKDNARWKGGRWKENNGYIVVNIGRNKKRREHSVVMENYLGRKLEPIELIHHIDGNKSNNNIENLFLCSKSKHATLHKDMEKIVLDLFKRGFIIFDKDLGEYKLK